MLKFSFYTHFLFKDVNKRLLTIDKYLLNQFILKNHLLINKTFELLANPSISTHKKFICLRFEFWPSENFLIILNIQILEL